MLHGRHGRDDVGSTAPVEKVHFRLSDSIRKGVAIAAPHEADYGRIKISLPSDAKILGVPNQIERVIANIVSNALQSMGPHDRIAIDARDESPSTVIVTIRNTGSYIPPEDQENIFQPFFTKGKAGGTGLGLAICRRIVADHGGSISVHSKEYSDTCFKIEFPLASNT